MTVRGAFSLNGLEQYLEQLAQAGQDVDAIAQKALAEAAEEVKAEMVKLAPEDTGELRNEISVEGPYQEGNFSYVLVGVRNADKSKRLAIKATVQEYGSTKQAAQSYVRPGIQRKKGTMRKALKNILTELGAA